MNRWRHRGARLVEVLERLAALRALRLIWLIVVFGVAGWYLIAHRAQIFEQPLTPLAIAEAFVFTLVGKFFAALQVRVALACCGEELALAPTLYAYSMSDMGKYIPGGIWSVVGRVSLYRALQFRTRVIGLTLLIEQAWYIGAAAFIGATLYQAGRWNIWVIIALAPLLLLTLLWGINRMTLTRLSPRSLFSLLAVQLTHWSLLSCGFVVLLGGTVMPLTAAGAFLLAFAAGMATPFAPGGIGVREAVIGLLLLPLLGASTMGGDLLISRVVWIAADISFALIVTFACRRTWTATVKTRNTAFS